VVEGLAVAAPGLTMIVVAHRLATVRRCGRIVVLEGGRVEAVGTWQELAAGCPAFRRLGHGDTEETP
jgi:ABC-type multidrug transport system fused ATPase/permease subunit